jgi:hypothetical protein
MDSTLPLDSGLSQDAVDFVQFCYQRRPIGWPEFYDEMSAVAAHRLFRGWGFPELAEHGVSFTLAEMPRLAALVGTITRADPGRGAPPAGRGTHPRTVSALRRSLATR